MSDDFIDAIAVSKRERFQCTRTRGYWNHQTYLAKKKLILKHLHDFAGCLESFLGVVNLTDVFHRIDQRMASKAKTQRRVMLEAPSLSPHRSFRASFIAIGESETNQKSLSVPLGNSASQPTCALRSETAPPSFLDDSCSLLGGTCQK